MLGIGLFSVYLIAICFITYYLRSSRLKQWWVKIVTEYPICTYYFGPFNSSEEAESHQTGYMQDLLEEGAEGIVVMIEYCQPKELTIFEESEQKSLVGSKI